MTVVLLSALLIYDLGQTYLSLRLHKNYYEFFSIGSTTSTQRDITLAYRTVLSILQVERNKTSDLKVQDFIDHYERQSRQAFEILSNPEKRLIYDTFGEPVIKLCGHTCQNLSDYYHAAWHRSIMFYIWLSIMACFESIILGCHRYLGRHIYWLIFLILACFTFEWYSVTSLALGKTIWITKIVFEQKLLPEKIVAWRQLIATLFLYAEFLLPTDQDEVDERPQRFSILLRRLNSIQLLIIRRLTTLFHRMTLRDH